MALSRRDGVLALLCMMWSAMNVDSYYLPGVNPKDYSKGDPVDLMVNKVTSSKTLIPLEYYRLPFCQPKEVQHAHENLGMFLSGDRIESSLYRISMLEPFYCEHLCAANMGKTEGVGGKPNTMIRAIKKEYHNNWIIDNLSAASKFGDKEFYGPGFPIGFVSQEDGRAFIHNHVNLNITYHKLQGKDEADDKYRVVRFLVEPLSIRHQYETSDDGSFTIKGSGVATCQENYNGNKHTDLAMINGNYQPASGEVLFTYDVIWTEDTKLRWASRWDIYLSMDEAIPAKVHWLSILNSLVIVFVLSAMIAAILVRNLRRDYARYNRLATDEEKAEDLEEFGWKLVHGDVFRPPTFSPMLLAVCCGTGVQLLCMAVLTIVVALMGFLSPAMRGALLMALLLLYVFMGTVAGYVTARLYKTFKGKSWQRATSFTAFGFPGLAFTTFFILDLAAIFEGSTDAVPFSTIVVLLVLWFGISTPLVFFGAYFGYKQDAIEFPVNTSNIPRLIPEQPWFMGVAFTLSVGGILPFGACFLELYFILSSVWMNQYYYVFGFLFLVFVILIVTCAEITILFCYFQLCGENYHWWWRSFCTSGSTAIYVFIYSFMYFRQLEENSKPSFGTYILYFGYMTLTSVALFLMTGCIGLLSCLWFNKTIFASIKID